MQPDRRGREAAGVLDPGPEPAQSAELRHREELVGVGREQEGQAPPGRVERGASSLHQAQVGDAAAHHGGDFLGFRRAGLVVRPSVGQEQGTGEASVAQGAHHLGDEARQHRPGVRGLPGAGQEAQGIDADVDVEGGSVDVAAIRDLEQGPGGFEPAEGPARSAAAGVRWRCRRARPPGPRDRCRSPGPCRRRRRRARGRRRRFRRRRAGGRHRRRDGRRRGRPGERPTGRGRRRRDRAGGPGCRRACRVTSRASVASPFSTLATAARHAASPAASGKVGWVTEEAPSLMRIRGSRPRSRGCRRGGPGCGPRCRRARP